MENTTKTPVEVLNCMNCHGTGYLDRDLEDECPVCDGYGSFDYETVAHLCEMIDTARSQVAYYRKTMPAKRETLTTRERRAVDETEVAA